MSIIMRNHWIPTLFVFSALITPSQAFDTPPLKVCIVSGSFEYNSDESLKPFSEFLERECNTKVTFLSANGEWENLPGLEALETCDVALFYTRRLRITGEQLELVKRYCLSGKPIVALRTASHGFQNFLEFDKEVLGGNYANHFSGNVTQCVSVVPEAKDHPVLQGITDFQSFSSLYRTSPLAPDCTVLMMGSVPNEKPEPCVWARTYKGGKVVYIGVGKVEDFENDTFKRLLVNSLFWTANREVERQPLPPVSMKQFREERPPFSLLPFFLPLRGRIEKENGWEEIHQTIPLLPSGTALLICDLWDKHWCDGATERVKQIAEKLAPVVNLARKKGILIIHAPSDTLAFYADHPQLRRVALAPPVDPPAERVVEEPPLPIDGSDGGCDTDNPVQYPAWTRQIATIEIGSEDIISQDGRAIYNYLKALGITNILYTGVHTNMCVLGRSFGMRQMSKWGMNCFLIRDLTDAMYDPKDPPHVSHEEGTELVVQHIEKYWGWTTTTEELMKALEP